MLKFPLLTLLLWLLCSCATNAVVLDDMNFSLTEIQKATGRILPGGIRSVSINQREYLSRYFLPNAKVHQPEYAVKAPKRAYARVVIQGDRRPYTVNVQVFIERRTGFRHDNREDPTYENVGQDEAMAAAVAQQIKFFLLKSRDNRNLIDDFRPF